MQFFCKIRILSVRMRRYGCITFPRAVTYPFIVLLGEEGAPIPAKDALACLADERSKRTGLGTITAGQRGAAASSIELQNGDVFQATGFR